MSGNEDDFRNSLKYSTENMITKRDPKKILNMNAILSVALIDDDPNIKVELERIFSNVSFWIISIEDLVKAIPTHRDVFPTARLIFIDTFYRDEATGSYALDFFELYKNRRHQAREFLEGKATVIYSTKEVAERLNGGENTWMKFDEETRKFKALMWKVRKYPNLGWGGKNEKNTKIAAIIEAIEKFAQSKNIYLYRKEEMSFTEWVDFIYYLVHETEIYCKRIQETFFFKNNDKISQIIDSIQDLIKRAETELNPDDPETKQRGIRTIQDAMDFVYKYCNELMTRTKSDENRVYHLARR